MVKCLSALFSSLDVLSQVFVDTGGGRMEPFEGYLERLTPPQSTKALKEGVPAAV